MLKINPKYRDLIPPLSAEEKAQLEANCLTDGIKHPIITWQGFIIDGHNRWDIVQEHGLDYQTDEMQFESESDVIVWMIRNQFGRRNLNAYTRGVLALQLEGVFREKAKENLVASGGDKKSEHAKSGSAMLPKPINTIDTRKEIAGIAKIGERTLDKVKTIEAKATPEVKAMLASGDSGVSINKVYQDIRKAEKKEERHIELEAIKATPKVTPNRIKLLEGDLFDFIDSIPDNSVDLLNTDPPYMILKDGWDTFKSKEDFLLFTEKWLSAVMPKVKSTGRVYISFATYYQYDFFNILAKHNFFDFIFKQTIIWYYKNNNKPSNKKEYRYMYEPIFYLYGKDAPLLNFEADSYGETQQNVWEIATPQSNFNEGKYHSAQKPIELYKRIIKTGSFNGDTVLDCFAGSGTTGIVCKDLDRDCILIEKDIENCKLIKGRV